MQKYNKNIIWKFSKYSLVAFNFIASLSSIIGLLYTLFSDEINNSYTWIWVIGIIFFISMLIAAILLLRSEKYDSWKECSRYASGIHEILHCLRDMNKSIDDLQLRKTKMEKETFLTLFKAILTFASCGKYRCQRLCMTRPAQKSGFYVQPKLCLSSHSIVLNAMNPETMDDYLHEVNFIPDRYDIMILKSPRYAPLFWHRHDFYEIVYVLCGKCTIIFRNTVLELSCSDFLMIAPIPIPKTSV